MKKIIRYCGLIILTASPFFLTITHAQAELYTEDTYEIRFQGDVLEKILLHSGYSFDLANKYGVVISDARITLSNRELGKTSSVGEIQVVAGDTIKFVAKEKLRFSPDSEGTSITFGKVASSNNDNSGLIVFTGRWTNFFGIRVCNGQVFNIPGESQCL